MTNQEAINKLIIARNVYDGMGESYKPWVEVIDMAISALQTQDVSDINVGDMISRRAAIDELVRWGKIPDYNDGERNMIGCVIGMLDTLPSAQPDLSGYSDRLWKAAYERGKAEAMEKQIPKKPKYKTEDRFVKNHFAVYSYCPVCEKEVVAGDMHCVQCGQAIDWEA